MYWKLHVNYNLISQAGGEGKTLNYAERIYCFWSDCTHFLPHPDLQTRQHVTKNRYVPFNLKWQQRKAMICSAPLLQLLWKEKMKLKAEKNQPLLSQHVHFICMCTSQNNIINAKFIQGKNTTWCHNYIVILCSLKWPSCCDCHMPLAIEIWFSCFSSHWMSNISYWGSQIHLMIFSTPLKWKWCMWQNSGINIIKEFDLQKPQHLPGWRE